MTKFQAIRYHDISCGHRVVGHESKCAHLHGHNYRITFYCDAQLDAVGRVMDFSAIKSKLCMWLEERWDHKMLISSADPMYVALSALDPDGIEMVPFNPTAENMAEWLLVNMQQRLPRGITLERVVVEETRKCSASAERP